MPCLVVVGHPSAGKTTLANLLRQRAQLHSAIDEVVVLNEESVCGCVQNNECGSEIGETSSKLNTNKILSTKQELYETSTAEKQTRGALKAAFDRAVKKTGGNNKNSRRLVILDSMNYIKGYRYELHCLSKASGEKHGILWVLNRLSVVQQWNTDYSTELLQELISRFEPPDDRNRWDKPLFTIDVAPRTNSTSSSNKGKEVDTDKLSSKNEVLENSVYNMHALGEAFGTIPASEQKADNATRSTSLGANSERSKKSAFTRSTKKSAFRRRNKTSTPSQKDKSKLPSGYNQENKIIFDTSMIASLEKDATPASRNVTGDNTSASKPALTSPKSSSEPEEVPVTKSLEEQLDAILDIFLLHTQNLKEGMSTRQYA